MNTIKTYTKKQLALMYFPQSAPRTAVNHLITWINRCQPLLQQLHATGYQHTAKDFTPRQVQTIFHYLGEP